MSLIHEQPPNANQPRPTWRVWSWRTLAAVVAAPFLVAVGLVVWMFVPRTSTETLPYTLYAGEVDGVPIVVEWPPYSPYHEDWPIPEGWTVENMPDSVIGTGHFFDLDAANWRVETVEHGRQARITNGHGDAVQLKRVAVFQKRVTTRGASVGEFGRTVSTELVSPVWKQPQNWTVPFVTEQSAKWFDEETAPVWYDWEHFYWSWTKSHGDGGDYQTESCDLRVVTETPLVLTFCVERHYSGCCRPARELSAITCYRDPTTGTPESVTISRFFRHGTPWNNRLDQLFSESFKKVMSQQTYDAAESQLEGVHYRGYPCVVAPGGFLIYNPWVVFAGSGPDKLFIPWSHLDDVLATDGPAAALRARPADES